jgi:hypothetical protein
MKSPLITAVVFLSSFCMMLPHGWCSVVLGAVGSDTALVASCCHRDIGQESSETNPEPSRPDGACCCCSRDAVLTASVRSLDADDVPDFSGIRSVVANVQPIVNYALTAVDARASLSALPLHLLHCVWRC